MIFFFITSFPSPFKVIRTKLDPTTNEYAYYM